MSEEIWVAHEDPDRPLAYGAMFCGCDVCATVLKTAALCQPELTIGVKFGMSQRLVVEAGVLGADGVADDDLVRRFSERRTDWVRDIWVTRDVDDWMSPVEAAFLDLLTDADIAPGAGAPWPH